MEHHFVKSKPYNGAGCPDGYHKRDSYKSSKGLFVPARCIRSTTVYKESSKQMQRRVTAKMARRLYTHIPSVRSLMRKDCPPGMVPRRAYTRRYSTPVRKAGITVHRKGKTYKVFPKSKTAVVKAKCVKGTPKTKSKSLKRFGPLRKGELAKLGYSSRLPDEQRRIALHKAVDAYTALGVYRKLDAVAKLTVRSIPSASAVYAKDRDWIKSRYGPLKAF